jgi:hypothetical protein
MSARGVSGVKLMELAESDLLFLFFLSSEELRGKLSEDGNFIFDMGDDRPEGLLIFLAGEGGMFRRRALDSSVSTIDCF